MRLSSIPLSEWIKSVPETFGIRINEEPDYAVLRNEGHYELRRYGPQLRASLLIANLEFDEFRKLAFERLAAYLFGKNSKSEHIAMTSPVLISRDEGGWRMSSVLPKKYSYGMVPFPNDTAIELEQIPSYDVVAYAFNGSPTLEELDAHIDDIRTWLLDQPTLSPTGNFFAALYDGPFVIPFLRKNEVHAEIYVLQ